MFVRICMVALFVAAPVVAPATRTEAQELDDRVRLSQIFSALGIKPGAVVADVGAGGGDYTIELAKAVGPAGRVLAVDISPRALERLRARVSREAATNVEVIEGAVDNPRLPSGTADAILVVHAYHEMTEHAAMLARMKEALKPDGRLVIVEPVSPSRRNATRDVQTRAHQLAPDYVQQEIRAAGFRMVHFSDPIASDHAHEGHSEWILAAQPEAPQATKAPILQP